MTTAEWLLVASTLVGPVLAVQAQKWVERAREASQRRDWIFNTLMATRGARLSFDHVRALNSIDLAFYGRRVLGRAWRSQKSQAVLDAWHDYYSHLNLPEERRPKNEAEQQGWSATGTELLVNLLDRLATATNHKFERTQLLAGSYSPEAHGAAELENQTVRHLALDVLNGRKSLPLSIKEWPPGNDEAVARQQEIQAKVVAILERLTRAEGHGGPDRPPAAE